MRHTESVAKTRFALGLLVLLFPMFFALGRGFHVRPNGSSSGDGSASRPWDLRTAFNKTGVILPGDTVWLHGGVYRGTFESSLVGTASSPVVVRSYPGEWAVIDNNGTNDNALWLKGAYTWFWGFEVMNSNPNPPRGEAGVNFAASTSNKLINVIIHDEGATGINPYWAAINSEVYGCLVYYNGRMDDPEHANGYGIYGQNIAPGRKYVQDNFFFNMFGIFPAHMAGSSNARLDDISFIGNTFFGHTLYDGKNVIALYGNFETGSGRNLNPEWRSNFFYRADFWLGYNGDGVENAVYTDNYFFRGGAVEHPANTYAAKSGNVFTSSGNQVFVRANRYADRYEPRRASIIVFNGSGASSVSVTLPAGVLNVGDKYQVRDVQNYFGTPITSGNYTGGAITIPMPGSGSPIAAPRSIPANRPGRSLPQHTSNEFGAFVLLANAVGTWPNDVVELPGVATSYALEQNYPNPFNPTTRIEFAIPEASHVNLTVYNMLGQEVKTLVDENLPAGLHRATFDAAGLPTGVYVYTITAGEYVSSRKMVLLK
ncbi:MAG: T9SS type A sorting domain-containing protein [Bacteroidota bacterium]